MRFFGIDELRSISMPERWLVIANFNLERQIDIAARTYETACPGRCVTFPKTPTRRWSRSSTATRSR